MRVLENAQQYTTRERERETMIVQHGTKRKLSREMDRGENDDDDKHEDFAVSALNLPID